MGTTTTAVGVLADHFFLSQVGDSRAYLIRNGQAVQLTRDQSPMQRLVEAGGVNHGGGGPARRPNILSQAAGAPAPPQVASTHPEGPQGAPLVLGPHRPTVTVEK